MTNYNSMSKPSQTVWDQVEHATRRPAGRVYLGTYENQSGLWKVFIQVEKADGKKKPSKGGAG